MTYYGEKGVFLAVFDPILLIFAGKGDMHESLDEWEVKPDPTKDYSVSCP